MIIDFSTNAKQEYAIEAVRSCDYNLILFGGAIRGGKTFWGLATLLILCKLFPGSRWCVIRENSEKIRTTTIPSFTKFEAPGRLRQSPYEYHHPNGSVILFKSENYAQDKELNWMRGLEVNGILFEEINECQHQTLMKAFERVGSWNCKGAQPFPYILATCNPTNGWVKELVYEPWKKGELRKNWLYIQSKITDNIKNLDPVYVESLKNLPQYEYEVFVNGNWDVQLKTGGEFFKEFDINEHVKPVCFNKQTTIHITIDNNVYPYIAIGLWQVEEGKKAKQFHEIAARDPNNIASKAGTLVVQYLQSINYDNTVFVYGDQTTTSRNTIDENKKSFLDLFFDKICEKYSAQKRIPSSNPPVALSGDFINAIYSSNFADIEIIIGEICKESINDYILTKQDKDGGILKKRTTNKDGISYEEHGHYSDTKRYFIVECFKSEFHDYKRRFNSDEQRVIGRSYTNRSF